MTRFMFALLAILPFAACTLHPDTPLTIASSRGSIEQVRDLLRKGADPNQKESHGWTPLTCAARIGSVDVIQALVEAGGNPNLRDSRNNWTPLMHALHKNQTDAAVALLNLGADANAGQGDALIMAAGYANHAMVRELFARGANPYAEIGGVTVLSNAVAGAWDIDYQWTGCGPHTETVRVLLTRAPDLKLKDNFWGRSALSFAKRKGCEELVSLVNGGKQKG